MSLSNNQADFIRLAREEIKTFYEDMQTFDPADPGSIFQKLAAMTARASYIRSSLVVRDYGPVVNNFRTKEIDPFISECDRQFKIWSRYLSVINLDWEIGQKN